MNAHIEIVPDEVPVKTRANAWRGQMTHLYATGEMLIAARLREIATGAIAMGNAQRIKKLKSHYKDEPKVVEAITAYEGCRARRNALVHGQGTISECAKGWVLNLEHDDGKDVLRDFILESESEALRKQLLAIVNRLRSRLNS